ncbi:hypothetical protein [Streptomyces iconiensis]|uniref:Uncharacterized protein n=1 Tax=Streptomyces iconiensis TaxID=1384038 RepID=A0ABT7A9Y6_9ACTN|nr:hypothetical protein [Streptomyces iconiensis]MDJ1137621.1 hypothetical protein [Streptomyces iconiensis]
MAQALAEIGSVTDAIAYRWLFWPDVVEVGGAVFVDLEGIGREGISQRLRTAHDSSRFGESSEQWTELINSFNYFEIGNIFAQWKGSQDSSEEVQLTLAASLIEPWTARIATVRPARQVEVQIAPPDPTLGVCIEVVQGTFSEVPSPPYS